MLAARECFVNIVSSMENELSMNKSFTQAQSRCAGQVKPVTQHNFFNTGQI